MSVPTAQAQQAPHAHACRRITRSRPAQPHRLRPLQPPCGRRTASARTAATTPAARSSRRRTSASRVARGPDGRRMRIAHRRHGRRPRPGRAGGGGGPRPPTRSRTWRSSSSASGSASRPSSIATEPTAGRARPPDPIAPADHVAAMGEDPVRAVRVERAEHARASAPSCSATATCAGVVNMGSTGAAVAAAQLYCGRLPGVRRPGIAVPFPRPEGATIVVDGGANPEARAEDLYQYAVMARLYARSALGGRRAPHRDPLDRGGGAQGQPARARDLGPLPRARRAALRRQRRAARVLPGQGRRRRDATASPATSR